MLNEKQQQALDIIVSGKHKYFGLYGSGGVGKASPLDEPVLTPDGWVKMEDINENDLVISEEGKPISVLKTFNHEALEMYEICFSDRSTTRCCIDHLWEVQTRKMRSRNNFKVMTLRALLPGINSYDKDSEIGYKYHIRLTKPIDFKKKDLSINPWELGYILGNGSSSKKQLIVSIGGHDIEAILPKFSADMVLSTQKKTDGVHIIAISSFYRRLYNSLGLHHVKSINKFIPKTYLMGSIKQRSELLAGLLDSDGSCSHNRASFSTSSRQLGVDIISLIRSLGGVARMIPIVRNNHKNTEYHISLRTPFNPFTLSRKAINYTVKKSDNSKRIISAKFIGIMPGKCLLVNSENHLYITRDYTVTHNTFLLKHLPEILNTVFTAPTNKAVSVLREQGIPGDRCMTIYKLLGLKLNEANGEVTIEKGESNRIKHFDTIVIDEGSMINDQLKGYIEEIDKHFIIVGDTAQLPPVGQTASNVFSLPTASITLTQQMRQEEENHPLMPLLAELRLNIPEDLERFKKQIMGNGQRIGINVTDDRYLFEKWIKAVPEPLVIAYTNAKVDYYNKLIRGDKPYFMPGDKLAFERPFQGGDYFTGEMLEIKNVAYERENIQFGIDTVYMDYARVNDSIKALVDRNAFNSWWTDNAYKLKQYPDECAYTWQNLYAIRERYADLRHTAAITSHKAQGSTYENVFVDVRDINRMPMPDRQRCLYVACSRAKKNVVMFV